MIRQDKEEVERVTECPCLYDKEHQVSCGLSLHIAL